LRSKVEGTAFDRECLPGGKKSSAELGVLAGA
jgi:hypothetical protein